MATKQVAIACQGGGTHAAFTWGVLRRILATKKTWDAAGGEPEFEIVGLSGTSAGALNAIATWYGLAPNRADPACGTLDKAIERLDSLWLTFGAKTPIETAHNALVQAFLHFREKGAPTPSSSPYDAIGEITLRSLSLLGARDQYLGFDALLEHLCPDFASVDWPAVAAARLRVLVSAIEVLSGNFELFDSDKALLEMGLPSISRERDQYSNTRWRMRRALTLAGVAASGTLPELLQAQRIDDLVFPTCEAGKVVRRAGYYWDGLYSQNPPVREFFDARERKDKPDEIWVIRINPQEHETIEGAGLDDIRDRMNALAGNLSLNQELDHVISLNQWLADFGDQHPPLDRCKMVAVRTIKMTRETAFRLRHTTKFDRGMSHLTALRDEGESVAAEWLAGWRSLGQDFPSYPDDARYPPLA